MTEIFKSLFDFLRLSPRYLISIGLVAGLILFGGDTPRNTLGIAQFAQDYRFTLGILFLSSMVLLLVATGSSGAMILQRWWMERRLYQRITKRLRDLTEGEKEILRYYIIENTRANVLRLEDGVVQELVAEGIIYRSSNIGSVLDGFAHNINDIAWDYLHVYPYLLESSTTISGQATLSRCDDY